MTSHLDERTYDLLFGIRRSVRYHSHRRRFYEIWNSTTITIGVLGGSSAATAFLAELPPEMNWLPALFAGIVVLLSSLDLSIGTARRANGHSDLARQFITLEQKFAHDRNLKDKEYEEIIKARLDIEAREPTPLRLLDVMCHYELLLAMGCKHKRPSIPWWRRKLAHWFSQFDYVQTTPFP